MDTAGEAYLPPKNLPEGGWTRLAGLIFRRRTCRGRRMDAAGGAYLPPKNLPERGWTRQARLTFRRRACRREDGHGRRGLSSAEELAGERMDTAGGAYLPPKSLPERGWTRQAGLIFRRRTCRREDGHGRRDLPSAEELAEAGGWRRQAGFTFRRRTCRGGRRTMKRRNCRCRPVPAKPGSIPFHTRRKPPAFCRVR